MSQTVTQILLPQTVKNDGSIVGTAKQAASYYVGNRGMQTINWSVSYATCTLRFQATLATVPSESDWFTVYEVTYNNETDTSYTNIPGNFVWMRAKVDNFSLGTINHAKLSY
jgi:hypothetical protein